MLPVSAPDATCVLTQSFSPACSNKDVDEVTLVYCSTGMASTALVVGYLMAKEGLRYDDAVAKVVEQRPAALPAEGLNRSLSRQLKTWAKWPEFPGNPARLRQGSSPMPKLSDGLTMRRRKGAMAFRVETT